MTRLLLLPPSVLRISVSTAARALLAVLASLGSVRSAVGFFDGVDAASRMVMDKARRQIEAIRQGNFIVRFIDAAGRPVRGSGEIRLVHHEFRFGANLCPVTRLPRGHPARRAGLEVIDELFPLVRVGNFWSVEQPELGGQPEWGRTDADVAWARAHGKQMRYHCLIYNASFALPEWYRRVESPAQWWLLIEKRIRDVAGRYGSVIHEYDVINEMIRHREWARRHNPAFPALDEPQNAARIIRMADRYLPDAELVMVETHLCSMRNPYFLKVCRYFREVLDLDPPVDVIGFQGHFYGGGRMPISVGHPQAGPGAFTMKVISEALDYLGALGKPVHITEFNPPSRMKKRRDPQPGLSEKEIAAWEENFYTLVFSKSYINELTRWFVVDGCGGNALDGGLVAIDGRKKANYYALRKLLKNDWTTEWAGEISGGSVSFRGFFGEYEARIPGYEPARFRLYSRSPHHITVRLRRISKTAD